MNPVDIERAEKFDTAEGFAFRVKPHPNTGRDEIIWVSKAEAREAVTRVGVFSTPSLERDMLRWASNYARQLMTPGESVHEYDPLNPPPSDADYNPLDDSSEA